MPHQPSPLAVACTNYIGFHFMLFVQLPSSCTPLSTAASSGLSERFGYKPTHRQYDAVEEGSSTVLRPYANSLLAHGYDENEDGHNALSHNDDPVPSQEFSHGALRHARQSKGMADSWQGASYMAVNSTAGEPFEEPEEDDDGYLLESSLLPCTDYSNNRVSLNAREEATPQVHQLGKPGIHGFGPRLVAANQDSTRTKQLPSHASSHSTPNTRKDHQKMSRSTLTPQTRLERAKVTKPVSVPPHFQASTVTTPEDLLLEMMDQVSGERNHFHTNSPSATNAGSNVEVQPHTATNRYALVRTDGNQAPVAVVPPHSRSPVQFKMPFQTEPPQLRQAYSAPNADSSVKLSSARPALFNLSNNPTTNSSSVKHGATDLPSANSYPSKWVLSGAECRPSPTKSGGVSVDASPAKSSQTSAKRRFKFSRPLKALNSSTDQGSNSMRSLPVPSFGSLTDVTNKATPGKSASAASAVKASKSDSLFMAPADIFKPVQPLNQSRQVDWAKSTPKATSMSSNR